jgi:phosphatidylglycerophosphatase A
MDRRSTWALRLATWFGCGYAKKAPGTLGAIGSIPVHLLLRGVSPALHAAVLLGITAAGVWSGNEAAKLFEEEDPQRVVIDEAAGALIAMAFVRNGSLLSHALAFTLFRVLDVTKPGIIHRIQHTDPPGVGIMLDDVLAGLIAGLTVRCLPGSR